MLEITVVHSLDLPELAPFRTRSRPGALEKQRVVLAEGAKVVERLIASGYPIISLLLTEAWLRQLEPQLALRSETIRAFIADKPSIEKITGYSCYQPVKAIGVLPPPRSLEEFLAQSARPLLFAAVDGISNAENLGVLVRNMVCFRVQLLLADDTSCSPYLNRVVSTSMGTLFRLPVVEVVRLTDTIKRLKSEGIRCVAAHPHDPLRRLSTSDFTGDCCVVFGSEGRGISGPLLEACDELVGIPMPPGVDSLNVGSAGAIFLYEIARQRGWG